MCEVLASEHRLFRYADTEAWPDGTIQTRYAFVHALFQHAARARTSSASLRTWHRRIAERLERGYHEHRGQIASELAEHYDEGHVYAKAIEQHATAGERALKRHGHAEALRHFRRALQILPSLPEARERDELELRSLIGLGQSQSCVEGLNARENIPIFERAVVLANALEDETSLAAAIAGYRDARIQQGEEPA